MHQSALTLKKPKRAIIAWAFYHWATAAFPTLITTFIFATYFTESIAKNHLIGTAQWGSAIALSGVLIAILSPIFGAIADHRGRRKPWLFVFTFIMAICSGLLWFIQPHLSYANMMLVFVIIGTVSYEIGDVFYNAMMQGLSPKNYIGRISGWAWGLGYAGGLICLVLTLLLFIKPEISWLGLNKQTAEQIRICGPFIFIWIVLFSWPIFYFTPDVPATGVGFSDSVSRGFKTLWETLRALPKNKTLFIFLIARMLYTDGLNTLFAFGGIYAAGTFHFSFSRVLEFGIAMNVTAGIGAGLFAWVDDWIGAKKTVLISLCCLMVSGIGVLLVTSLCWFWILSLTLGFFVGPVQAASRSFMVRIAPPKIVTELFGLYALSGKATAFINPWLVGLLTVVFGSQRIGMSSIFIFLLLGGLLLLRVSEKNSHIDVQ